MGLLGQYRIFQELYTSRLAAAVAPDRPQLLSLINLGFDRISKEEGAETLRRWGQASEPGLPPWIIKPLVVGGLGFLLAALLVHAILLRLQVRRRTSELNAAFDLSRYQKEMMERELVQRQKTEEELRDSEERYRVLAETAGDVIGATDLDGRISYLNKAGLDLGGRRVEDVLGRHIDEFFPPEDDQASYGFWDGRTHPRELTRLREITLKTGSGRLAPLEIRASVLRKNNQPSGLLFIARDITDRKEALAKIEHLASHDALTGLANRRLLFDALVRARARAQAGTPSTFALLFLSLDGFKPINDLLGHEVGDGMLVTVSRRLAGRLRASDCLARIGGDEFAVVLEDVEDPSRARDVALTLIEAVKEPLVMDHREIHFGVSLGMAWYPQDADNPDILFARAEAAMYHAKKDGGGLREWGRRIQENGQSRLL
jgi:diguanylate cyclase (GGDEF)-like protein/PAS domain S-box-containing protein